MASEQYVRLLHVYINFGHAIRQECIKLADEALENFGDDVDQSDIFDDGVFDPVSNLETMDPQIGHYLSYIEENGNSEDETILLNSIWVIALSMKDATKYQPIIKNFSDIIANGL